MEDMLVSNGCICHLQLSTCNQLQYTRRSQWWGPLLELQNNNLRQAENLRVDLEAVVELWQYHEAPPPPYPPPK